MKKIRNFDKYLLNKNKPKQVQKPKNIIPISNTRREPILIQNIQKFECTGPAGPTGPSGLSIIGPTGPQGSPGTIIPGNPEKVVFDPMNNVQNLNDSIDTTKLYNLNPILFTTENSDIHIGLDPVETNKLVPNLVSKDSLGKPNGINYIALSVLILEELKKVKEKLEQNYDFEDEQIERVYSPARSGFLSEEEDEKEHSKNSKQSISIKSVKSMESNKSDKSMESNKSIESVKSDKSMESNKSIESVKSDKSNKSIESVKSDKSTESIESVKSIESIKSDKSTESNSSWNNVEN